jgi:hypothetical protein
VTLTAVPNAGYQFSTWTGCPSASGATCTISNITGNVSVTATFGGALGYTLVFGGDGSGTVTTNTDTCQSPTSCGSSGGKPGDGVTMIAQAGTGMLWGGWDASGPCAGQGPTCIFQLSAVRTNTVTAVFFRGSYTLTLGLGISCSDSNCSGSGTYARGTAMSLFGQKVTITRNPKTGITTSCIYDVSSWSGCDSHSGDNCYLSLYSDTDVSATFKTTATSCNTGIDGGP